MRRIPATAVTTAVATALAILTLPSVAAAHGGHSVPAGIPEAAHLHLGGEFVTHAGVGLLIAVTVAAGVAYVVRKRLARHGRRG